MSTPSTIAIDGPVASGKSTVGQMLAQQLGYLYFDTGVMYRAVTWVALQRNVPIDDEPGVTRLAESVQIRVTPPSVDDGRQYDVYTDAFGDVTWDIRRPEVEAHVSPVSAYVGVRKALTEQQRTIGRQGRVVMVGRDIGTVVLPDADLKVYLEASAEERAHRRHKELLARGRECSYDEVLANTQRRDRIDSTRAAAPLKPADDAIILPTDDLTVEGVVQAILRLIAERSGAGEQAMAEPRGMVARIEPGSIAEELGLEPGDQIVAINGHVLRDVIDYRFYGADEELSILVRRGDEEAVFEVERDYGVDLGIEFTEPTFDGIRTCANNCTFCFIKGIPRGMRPSLYVKDDDYRLAFLIGNFITLSNLSETDWQRIQEQHLSPLYVSVHATNEQVRRRLLGGSSRAPDILPQLRRLRDLQIEVHTQVVLTPGLNDGPELARTVADLSDLWPAIRSVACVPVGLTRFQADCLRAYHADEAAPVIEQVETWQTDFRALFGVRWIYAADEWYLLDSRAVPGPRAYDGFPQLENGIGLVRKLLQDWTALKRHQPIRPPPPVPPITLVCGMLIAPVLAGLASEVGEFLSTTVRVLPVVNDFFGPGVTVSGLLTGQDVRRALARERPRGSVFLPRSMFNREGTVTLDDLTPEDIGAGLEARVALAGKVSEVVSAAVGAL